MDPTLQVILFWVAFGATHTVISHPPVRDRIVGVAGERAYLVVYSLVALATFVPLVWTFFAHRVATAVPLPVLIRIPGIWWLTMAIMLFALNLSVLGFASPNPVSKLTGRGAPVATGALRITRHPGFMGVALFGLAHLLVNHAPIDRAFFGGMALYPLIGCAHQDWRRRRAEGEALDPFFAATSFLPFVAIVEGRNRLAPGELSRPILLVATGLFGLLFFIHHRLFA